MKRLLSTLFMCLMLQASALFAQQRYNLTVRTTPQAIAGIYFQWWDNEYDKRCYSSEKVVKILAGTEVDIILDNDYQLLGFWKLKEWRFIEGNANLTNHANANWCTITMPSQDITLVAVMEYNPDNPYNPMPNGWYPDEGKLVIDNDEDGYDPIASLIGDQEDYPLVKTFIQGGYISHPDQMILYNLTGEKFPALKRVDLSRCNGITEITNLRDRPWTELILPASVKAIYSSAFSGTFIEALTIFATTPPVLSYGAFPSESDMTVFVPEEALPLYQNSDDWKDFTLRPIIENAGDVTVRVLPDAPIENLVPYYGMTLELQNVKSLETRRMLITSRHDYVFRTLPSNTVYNVRLLNRAGSVVGHLENVYLEGSDISVDLNSLRPICSLQLRVQNDNAPVKSEAYSVVWIDNSGNVVGHLPTVDGVMGDEPVKLLFNLTDNNLKKNFRARDTIIIDRPIDKAAPKYLYYQLRPTPIRKVTTRVVRADGSYMGQHNVRQSIYRITNEGSQLVSDTTFNSPTLQGDYPYQGLTTDVPVSLSDGEYEMTIQVDGANLESSNRRFTLSCDTTQTFYLAEVSGSVIKATWVHYGVANEGADITTARRTDKRLSEASFTIIDQTNGVELKNFAVSTDNTIRLIERLEPGTQVEVTLGNRDGQQFASQTLTGKADEDGNLSFDFTTRDYGTLVVTFNEAECNRVAIKVFDAVGKLVAANNDISWQSNRKAFTNLKDGNYTVMLMESGTIANAMNSFDDVCKFLREGIDYILDYATLTSGQTTVVNIPKVPALNSRQLYTDDTNTRITPKRVEMTPGALQTISAQVDFLPEYKGRVSQLKAIFTIPEDETMHFVEGSVILNNDKAPYQYAANELEVPIVEGRLLRFCVVPIVGGQYTINGRIAFMLDGEEHEQSLPSSSFKVEGATIRVLPETAFEYAPVQGMAIPNTEVTLVVNGSPVGTTKSDANGEWLINCPINNSYNMCINTIYAQYKGYDGLMVKTQEKQVTFNRYGIRVDKIIQEWVADPLTYEGWWKPSITTFDFVTNTVYPKGYSVVSHTGHVSYEIELATSDTTYIDDVILYVETNSNREHQLHAKYNGGNKWYAATTFPSGEYPISVGAEIRHHAPNKLGNEGITGRLHYWDDYLADSKQRKTTLAQLSSELENAESGSEAEQQAMYNLMKYVGIAQDGYLEAYEKNKDNPDFDPEHPDPANPYFPGYQESYYPEGEAGLNLLTQDVNDTEYDLNAITEEFNLNDDEKWTLPDSYNMNELGQIIPGYTVSKISAETRQYFESRRSHQEALANGEDGVYEYVVETETGNGVLLRMTDKGYTLIIPDEDVQVDVDFNAANPELAAALRQLHQVVAEARRLLAMAPDRVSDEDEFERNMNGVIDNIYNAVTKLSNTLGAYYDWLDQGASLSVQAYRDTKAQGWRMWRSYNDVVRRGFGETVQGKDLLKRCKINGLMTAQKLDRLDDLRQFFERMRVSKVLGPIFGTINLYSDFNDLIDAIANAIECYNMIPKVCKDDQAAANAIRRDLVIWGEVRIIQKSTSVVMDIGSLTSAIAGLISAAPTGGTGTLIGGGISLGISAFTWVGNLAFDWAYGSFFDGIRSRIEKLKCEKVKKEKEKDDKHEPKIGPATPLIDPSGYIYEAVPSNRVPDAIASVYCKDTYEDLYGDEHERVTLWDAESYGYVNPQLTDENGEYGWDVPAGQWQVRVTKEGYRAVSSEWLPVPPPQLDVNLELQQPSAPVVERVIATEQGVQVDFDKYMKPQHLTTDNIFLTKNGEKVEGTITLLNAEATLDETHTYASRLLFEPATKLTKNETVRLTVKAGIESYANVAMQNDYTQEFNVEQRVEQLVADNLCMLTLNESRPFTISAVPAAVAAGKRVLIASQNENVVTTDVSEVTLDANAQATITLSSKAYGSSTVSLTLADDAEIKQAVAVSVKDKDELITEAPEASRVSGTEVENGATVRLSCNTPNAVIYYTLDETCPCDNPERLRYDGPIVIESDVTIKALAVAPGYAESEVVTYTYRLKDGTGIKDVDVTPAPENNDVYDLQGRKLTNRQLQQPQLRKGIYIRNGDKVVIK